MPPSFTATPKAKAQAKYLRAHQSPPEAVLWHHFRRKQLGVRIRRQHPIGPYIADFYCISARLVIEVDGSTHRAEQRKHDQQRDAWMAERGVQVLRISARDVSTNLGGIVRTVRKIIDERVNASSGSGTD